MASTIGLMRRWWELRLWRKEVTGKLKCRSCSASISDPGPRQSPIGFLPLSPFSSTIFHYVSIQSSPDSQLLRFLPPFFCLFSFSPSRDKIEILSLLFIAFFEEIISEGLSLSLSLSLSVGRHRCS